jgi:hypothetical protein
VISFYYLLISDAEDAVTDGRALPVVVVKDRGTCMLFLAPLPSKGVSGESVHSLATALHTLGRSRMVLRSDQETSLKALLEDGRDHGDVA